MKNNGDFTVFSEGVDYAELDAKKPEELTEEEKIALLGRPRLGDVTKIQIRIRESKEFKVKIIFFWNAPFLGEVENKKRKICTK